MIFLDNFLRPNNPIIIAAALIAILALFFVFQGFKQQAVQSIDTQTQKQAAPAPEKTGFKKAPELVGIKGYINGDPGLGISSLKGKVVLVDFWTYTCINCIRTLPYLKSWHEKYADDGLVIIGVHTPEFEFEKEYVNVKNAVEKYGLKYPVVQDNDYATWNAYANHYWPHKYLVDADGYIRYDHIGEGGYDETEAKIVELLKERDAKIEMDKSAPDVQSTDFGKIGTPELYLGFAFARAPLGNPEGFRPGEVVPYTMPNELEENTVYLDGNWVNQEDSIKLASDKGKVALGFTAKNVNIVAGSEDGSELSMFVDNRPVSKENAGRDAIESEGKFAVEVKDRKLYNLVSAPDYSQKLLVIEVKGRGFELYTFTFG